MFLITYTAAILSIVSFVSAVILIIFQTNLLSRLLGFYALITAVWIGGNAIADVAYTIPVLMLSSGIAFVAGTLNILLFLILTDVLIDGKVPSRMRLALYTAPAFALSLTAFTDYAVVDTHFPINLPAQITPGPLYLFAFIYMLVSLFYGSVRLLRALADGRDELRRIQLSYVLVGVMLMLIGGLTFDLAMPLIGEVRFYSLGPITSIFFILGTGYAITQQNLFDLRFVIQRGMIYTFLLVIIIVAYAGTLSAILMFSTMESEAAMYASTMIVLVAGIFGVPIIESYFKRMTDSLFFKQAYDYSEAVQTLSEVIHDHIELQGLKLTSENTLKEILRAESVRIEYPRRISGRWNSKEITEKSTISIPIYQHNSYTGIIHAGPKLNGDQYTNIDHKLLSTFAIQIATALSRAELYHETKQQALELEKTVKERTQELIALQDRERRMLTDLSHNIQTPLTVLQVRLDQLTNSTYLNDEVSSLQKFTRRLSAFAYDLLSLAKLESGVPAYQEPVSLSSIVFDIVEELQITARASHVQIYSQIECDLMVIGDRKQLHEAILNIASNALKYMKTFGERKIAFKLTRESSGTHLVVTDTGRGISKEDLPHVFERFYRSRMETELPSGSGLGLSIAKTIIEHHEGRLEIQSTQDQGTAVHIYLPGTLTYSKPNQIDDLYEHKDSVKKK